MKKYGKVAAFGLVVLGLLVLLPGCSGEDRQAILDLVPLQVQLASEYGGSNVVVELQNGNAVGVTCVDSLADSPGQASGAQQARDIALFVYEHYASMEGIDQVWVAFASNQDRFLAGATASVIYSFDKSELGCGDS